MLRRNGKHSGASGRGNENDVMYTAAPNQEVGSKWTGAKFFRHSV
jgi:hypothetical protein